MKNLLFSKYSSVLLLLLFVSTQSLLSQSETLFPCGTVDKKSDWLFRYQQSPDIYNKGGGSLLYVPLTIHILGTDEGIGYYRTNQLLDALCTLNSDYEDANISFYIEGDIDYINNTSWFDHETTFEGYQMMLQNDVPNTLNCYFVADPAGNCGYNLPYASLAVAKSCASPNDHTWAHEIGHALSLPHPFLGWEGGITYDGTMPPSFGTPAPEIVTYDYTDFRDTLILDTLIIDTAYVELVDGSNCLIAADGFCDTSPDYIANRWDCNNDGVSSFTQTDPNGDTFRSDGSLIMSYSDDACANRFSPDQIGAMRADLLDEHPTWLGNESPLAATTNSTTLIAPVEGTATQFNQVVLEWDAVENATSYVILVSRLSNFSAALTVEFRSDEPTILIESLDDNKTYYWKVRAYNAYNFCTEFSNYDTFKTTNMVANQNLSWKGEINLYPTTVNKQQQLHLVTENTSPKEMLIGIFSPSGQSLFHKTYTSEKTTDILVPNSLTSGLYFLTVKTGENQAVFRFIVE